MAKGAMCLPEHEHHVAGVPDAAEMDKRVAGQCSYAGYCAMFRRIEMGWDAARWDHKIGEDEGTKT